MGDPLDPMVQLTTTMPTTWTDRRQTLPQPPVSFEPEDGEDPGGWSYDEITQALDAIQARDVELDRAQVYIEAVAQSWPAAMHLPVVQTVLGLSSPWPVTDVLTTLITAVEHLLADHNCDAHGHEAWRDACMAGQKILERLHKDGVE